MSLFGGRPWEEAVLSWNEQVERDLARRRREYDIRQRLFRDAWNAVALKNPLGQTIMGCSDTEIRLSSGTETRLAIEGWVKQQMAKPDTFDYKSEQSAP